MKTTRHDSFAAYVLPSVLAFALSGLYTIVDGFFIGQSLGDLGLAAITLAYPAAALLQAVGTGIGLAGAIRCTILQARGEEQTPRTCFSGTVLLLLATSAAFAAVLLGLLGPVLTVLGAQDEARPLAAEYIRVIAYGTAFQILATGLVPFIRNLGGSAFAMVAMGTGFVTNIALDYLFVWEFHWGMAGGAWATVIGQAATMLLAIGYLVRRRVGFVPPKAGEVLPLWGALLKVAAAPVGLTFSPNITLMVMNHFLLRYGGALAIAAASRSSAGPTARATSASCAAPARALTARPSASRRCALSRSFSRAASSACSSARLRRRTPASLPGCRCFWRRCRCWHTRA